MLGASTRLALTHLHHRGFSPGIANDGTLSPQTCEVRVSVCVHRHRNWSLHRESRTMH